MNMRHLRIRVVLCNDLTTNPGHEKFKFLEKRFFAMVYLKLRLLFHDFFCRRANMCISVLMQANELNETNEVNEIL